MGLEALEARELQWLQDLQSTREHVPILPKAAQLWVEWT